MNRAGQCGWCALGVVRVPCTAGVARRRRDPSLRYWWRTSVKKRCLLCLCFPASTRNVPSSLWETTNASTWNTMGLTVREQSH